MQYFALTRGPIVELLNTRRLSNEIAVLARQDAGCARLMGVPGIGPIISSAMVAAIGTGDAFAKGRDFSAWLGLVPKQVSTGDRTILGKISKRGNRYLRVLFDYTATSLLLRSLTSGVERRIPPRWPLLRFKHRTPAPGPTWLLNSSASTAEKTHPGSASFGTTSGGASPSLSDI